jgi:hypothetical protein
MQRTSGPGTVAILPAPETPTTTPGYAAIYNPATGTSTALTPTWGNSIQEELMSFLAFAGITANVNSYIQVLQAAQAIGRSVIQLTASSGSFVVPQYVYRMEVECWGGGGGASGGTGGAGGAGGYCYQAVQVTPGQVIPYTVGAAGAGNSAYSLTTAGGNTTFLGMTAFGGGATGGGAGVGGAAAGGTINWAGGSGQDLDGSNVEAIGGFAYRSGIPGHINTGGATGQPVGWGAGGSANAAAGGLWVTACQGGILLKY